MAVEEWTTSGATAQGTDGVSGARVCKHARVHILLEASRAHEMLQPALPPTKERGARAVVANVGRIRSQHGAQPKVLRRCGT